MSMSTLDDDEFDLDFDDDCETCGQTGGHGLEGCPDDWHCVFPDNCCMPDPHHHNSQCHTPEMLEAEQQELRERMQANHGEIMEDVVEAQPFIAPEDMGYGDADDGVPF